MGTAAALVYVTLGRRRIDYRFILAGAVAPDLVDASLAAFRIEGPTWRGPAHSLAALVVVTVVIVAALRGETRLRVFGLAVGWLMHLVGDGMWTAPQTFFWPAFGSGFSMLPGEPYSWDLVVHPLAHLTTWAGEVLGAAVLVWFWVAFRLGEDGRGARFARDGYLRP
ncbi:MAG: metal-dependent hydrolase [Actinomycetota bacterium]